MVIIQVEGGINLELDFGDTGPAPPKTLSIHQPSPNSDLPMRTWDITCRGDGIEYTLKLTPNNFRGNPAQKDFHQIVMEAITKWCKEKYQADFKMTLKM